MKIKSFPYFALLISFFVSCVNKENVILNNNTVYFNHFPKEKNIDLQKIVEYKNGIPKKLFLKDTMLILFNYNKQSKNFFYNYSLSTHKFSNGYLKKGRGPGESIGAFCTGIYNGSIWVYDPILKKILISKTKGEISEDFNYFEESQVNTDYYQITLIDTSRFAATGNINSQSKFQIIDLLTGKEISSFGAFAYVPKGIPMDGLKDAYQAFILSNPNLNKIALAYRFTDVLEVYDLSTKKSINVQGENKIDIDFKIKQRGITHFFLKDTKTKKTFINAFATDKYIYLAYSGQSRSETWSYAKSIYVYNWDGKPVKKLNLNKYIFTFCVSSNDKILYAYTPDDGFLVKFLL